MTGDSPPRSGMFWCPACIQVYQLHWRDPEEGRWCRTCAAERRGDCQFADHPGHRDRHPCSYGTEEPGTPCRYCATPVPMDGTPCPRCWQSFGGMTTAEIKAVFAADGTFNVNPEVNPT